MNYVNSPQPLKWIRGRVVSASSVESKGLEVRSLCEVFGGENHW